MPYFNVVKRRVDWAEIIVQADSYEEAMKIAATYPIEPNEIEYDEWEIDSLLGGVLDKPPLAWEDVDEEKQNERKNN